LEDLDTEKVNVIEIESDLAIESECSSPPPELVEYAQTGEDVTIVHQEAESDYGTSV
jgi:hypothetical protein